MKVWKFQLALDDIEDVVAIEMPEAASVLHVGEQGGALTLWALVDPDAPRVSRWFRIAGTGHAVSEPVESYVGTAILLGGAFVVHVFDRGAGS